MEVRDSILKAAEFIEANPSKFDFFETLSPGSLMERGCYVGWIALFAGKGAGLECGCGAMDAPLCRELLGVSFDTFQRRLGDICITRFGATIAMADSAGAALRAYADKYHPAPQLTLDTKSQRHTTPQVTTTPQYPWQELAARLAREPRAEVAATANSIP